MAKRDSTSIRCLSAMSACTSVFLVRSWGAEYYHCVCVATLCGVSVWVSVHKHSLIIFRFIEHTLYTTHISTSSLAQTRRPCEIANLSPETQHLGIDLVIVTTAFDWRLCEDLVDLRKFSLCQLNIPGCNVFQVPLFFSA